VPAIVRCQGLDDFLVEARGDDSEAFLLHFLAEVWAILHD